MTYGAHDGFPANSGGPFPHYQRWFDHYLLGVNNGIERDPVVQLLLGNGSREALLSGDFTRVNAADWPVPGTRWQALFLDAAKAGSANSINDGTLSASAPLTESTDAYLSVPSLPTATDPHTTSTVAGVGYGPLSFGALFNAIPALTQMNSTDPVALTWTTPAFAQAVDSAGPAALDIFLASTSPEGDLHAVIADVWPDGNAWPVAQGRLRISFPDIIAAQSVSDVNGEVVQPYGDFSAKQYAVPGQLREYHVEFWPIGNHFAAGHRLRLYLVGASGYMMPSIPGINLAHAGGATPSRLLLPVLPGSDAIAAMGSAH
jgi:putative CocE/NonD family hydrolase